MMTCREMTEFLMDYLDGELSPEVNAQFEEHIAKCGDCVRFIDTYKKTIQLGKAAMCDKPETAPPVPEGLVQAILKAKKTQS